MGADFIAYMLVKKRDTDIKYDLPDGVITDAAKQLIIEKEGEEYVTQDKIKETKQDLLTSIQNVKSAMEYRTREAAVFHGKQYDYLITGGMSWGDSPTDLSDSIDDLVLTNLDIKMGFSTELP